MPAATTTIAPEPPQAQVWYRPIGDKVMEPFSSSITAAEHKIRNLEKRKVKLDQYRTEQDSGKTLNADQLAAVAKYNEVVQQLDFNRELVSSLKQVHQQTIKYIKQELRRENAERNKFILALQAAFYQLEKPDVRRDFLMGEHGAPKINQEDLVELTELSKLLKPSLREPDFAAKIDAGAEILGKLFESRGKINNKPSQQVKSLIDSIAESQYFTSGPNSPNVPETVKKVQEVPPTNDAPNPIHPPEIPIPISNPVSAQMIMAQDRDMVFSFMQESQLEIESPHMDPAVVAVSSYVPPPQIQSKPENNHVYKAPPAPESLNNIQSGIRDLNLNHMNSNNVEEEEWDDKLNPNNFNNTNGNAEGDQDNSNGIDRGSRGAFRGKNGSRGRGGRGNGNGYGNSRPPRGVNRGGFNNHRGGHFRADRTPSDTEIGEFRGKGPRGGGGGYSRPFNRNGTAPTSGGPPPIRRGGSRQGTLGVGGGPKPYNGIHEPRQPDN